MAASIPAGDYDTHLATAIQLCINMLEAHERQPATPARYGHVGRARARRELDDVTKHFAAAARALEGLHAEAVAALADLPPGGNWLQPWLMAPTLRGLAERARRADVSTAPAKPSIPAQRDAYAGAVASVAAVYYALVTGTAPTIISPPEDQRHKDAPNTAGRYVALVHALFAAMGVDASPPAAARAAVRQWRAASPGHSEPVKITPEMLYFPPGDPRGGKSWARPAADDEDT